MERIARIVGLDIAGIDVISPTVEHPIAEIGGGIVEVNAAPGFRMHTDPTEGTPRDVAGAVIDMLYPPGTASRIPIVSVTGTNGKTTTTRLLAHVARYAGHHVGLTTTEGVYVGSEQIMKGDCTGPASAQAVLRDPTVTFAALETARGGLLRFGLGYDWANVGVVTNIAADHLGLRDIETLEDLARVKSLVVERRVPRRRRGPERRGPDDALDRRPRQGADRATSPSTRRTRASRRTSPPAGSARSWTATTRSASTGRRCASRSSTRGRSRSPSTARRASTSPTPSPPRSRASPPGIELDDIRGGLTTFHPTPFQAPGRGNVYEFRDFRVMIDYCHNAHGMAHGGAVPGVHEARRASIGVLNAPGDRRDEDFDAITKAAAPHFDHVILRDDEDLRGPPARRGRRALSATPSCATG